ncbi:MAG: hypothetical protein ACRD5H_00210 [Nitrososphaerales archaeon]
MKITQKQAKLNDACKNASWGGVGWQGVVNKDGTVDLRREEEYANRHDSHYVSLEAALQRLVEELRVLSPFIDIN